MSPRLLNTNAQASQDLSDAIVSPDEWNDIRKPDHFGLTDISKLLICDVWSDDDASVVENTLKELADKIAGQTVSSLANLQQVHLCGGHSIALAVLRKWYSQPKIQANGLRLLAGLVLYDTDIREDVSKLGGTIQCARHAMQNFPFDDEIQKQGCSICWSLAYCPKSRPSIGDSDTLRTILDAMENFPDTLWVQRCACGCLHELSRHPESKKAIIGAGCVTALAKTFERFETRNTNVQTTAEETAMLQSLCSALKNVL